MLEDILKLLTARNGHFLLESGHHSDLWLDLEALCIEPARVQLLAAELANRLKHLDIGVVCGPLVEGAFVAMMVASELDVPFTYAERYALPGHDGLFPMGYRIPQTLRGMLRNKRVAIINDVTSAGSAVRGTFADLKACGAKPVAVGTLLLLGDTFGRFAAAEGLVLESLATHVHVLWTPVECPLCVSGTPLTDMAGPGGDRRAFS